MQESEQLRKQLDRAQQEIKNITVERERFQSQLEKLVNELAQKEVSLRQPYIQMPFHLISNRLFRFQEFILYFILTLKTMKKYIKKHFHYYYYFIN